jgi:cation:H+ antiporter
MATVTSLPELVTGLSAVMIATAPDLAVGDALGSCVFNLAILAVADLVHRKRSFYADASRVHVVSAAFGIGLLAMAGIGIATRGYTASWSVAHVSAFSLALIVAYVVAMRTVFRAEQRSARPPVPMATAKGLRQALGGYALAAIVIVVAGIWLPLVGVQLARIMGRSDSFVGTLFIALATSTPELATTLAAVRMGAIDLALGNILGSNLFDLLIVAMDDIAYIPGSIFLGVSSVHVMSVLCAALMNVAVIVALLRRPAGRVLRTTSWAGVALAALWLFNAIVQYRHAS